MSIEYPISTEFIGSVEEVVTALEMYARLWKNHVNTVSTLLYFRGFYAGCSIKKHLSKALFDSAQKAFWQSIYVFV